MGRNSSVDIIKGIGIILVIMGHISENLFINRLIYSFHMPLFFILSGYAYINYNKTNNIKDFIIKKLKTIVIPYFIYGGGA